jgi:lysophospholipase L1-like esterase
MKWLAPKITIPALIVALAGVITLYAVNSGQSPQSAPGPPTGVPTAIVSLGDSTASGEGGGDYTADTNGANADWCHRSANAIVQQVQANVDKRVNLACSGAKSEHIAFGSATQYGETSQAARLQTLAGQYRIKTIVVAVGANDEPQFGADINACAQAWFSKTTCESTLQPTWKSKVDAMTKKVTAALKDVRTAMSNAHYRSSDYALVVQSYASPLGPDVAAGLQDLSGCPFQTSDLKWIESSAVEVLAAGIQTATESAQARYLNLARAGIGHEACSSTNEGIEWFTRLTVKWSDLSSTTASSHALQESFHPNKLGYANLASCLSRFLATTSATGTCTPTNDGLKLS